MAMKKARKINKFQSTHPVRGATFRNMHVHRRIIISIHAPREGCDACYDATHTILRYFNPRTP